MFSNNNKYNHLYVFLVIIAGLLLRFQGVENTLLDYASYRQTYTAMFAHNYFLNGIDIFHPQINIIGIKNISEFPLYPAFISILYKIFGPHEIIGRIVSILFFGGAALHFYRLVRNLFDEKTGLYALLLYSFLPMMVYYNRTYMLESMMMYFSLACLDWIYNWFLTDSKKDLILGFIYLSIVLLLKIPTVYLLLPITYLFYKKSSSTLAFLKYISITCFIFIPSILWYFVVPEFIINENGIIDQSSSLKAKVFSLEAFILRFVLYSSFSTWKKLFITRIFDYHITPIGSLLILVWTYIKFSDAQKRTEIRKKIKNIKHTMATLKASSFFLLLWIIGFLIFMLAFPVFNILHEYYQIPLLAPIAIILALIIVNLFDEYLVVYKHLRSCIIGFFILLAIYSGFKVGSRLRQNHDQYNISIAIQSYTNKNDRIAILDSLPKPEVFYYSKRSGFIIPVFAHADKLQSISEKDFYKFSVNLFDSYKKKGSKVLVIPDAKYPKLADRLIKRIRQNCKNLWVPKKPQSDIQGIYSMDCSL